jgi:DNA-binding ferritin-like protein
MTYSETFADRPIPVVEQVETIVTEVPEMVARPTVEELSSQLVGLASYTNQLYTQSHLIHLNIEGPIFLPIHEYLKGQYELHIEQFDALSEFVRTLDFFMPMCARGLQQAYKSFKHVKSYEMRDMLTTYLNNLEKAGMMAKDMQKVAKEVDAPDIENYLAEYVGASFKAAWFLKATLRG